jgi:hypothetical protein
MIDHVEDVLQSMHARAHTKKVRFILDMVDHPVSGNPDPYLMRFLTAKRSRMPRSIILDHGQSPDYHQLV